MTVAEKTYFEIWMQYILIQSHYGLTRDPSEHMM